MAKNDEGQTLADYVAIAISPALIMALVSSLVFFLVAVMYRGEFAGRLNWILFFFVFGSVLVARISMTSGIADRAGVYGFILGGLVWIGLLIYVDWKDSGPLAPFGWLIDLGLVIIVWWCAHRLTWDCTLIDDDVDASGVGLLQEAGLEKTASPEPGKNDQADKDEDDEKGTPEKLPGFVGWWERYLKYREEKKAKPHAPGVWVVYFSLAALPLYGLGQALMAADTSQAAEELVGRRQYSFWLMTIYVASGLGLLLTTSFLGLRRYLRQRKLQMPIAMAGVWLLIGGILIVSLLFLGVFLPRPHPEYEIVNWTAVLDSPDKKASEHDQRGGTGGKDKGKQSGQKPRDGNDQKQDDKARDSGEKDKPGDKDGNTKDKDAQSSDKDKRDASGKGSQKDKDKTSKRDSQRDNQKDKQEASGKDQPKKDDDRRREGDRQTESESDKTDSNPISDFSKKIANFLKWVVGIIAALLVIFLVLRSGLKFLANFTHWAKRMLEAFRNWWQGWLDWWSGKSQLEEQAEQKKVVVIKPFAEYRDPFLWGAADGMSDAELVRYCFEALQAWAIERDLARQIGETPWEFANRLVEETPALETEVRGLANFYAQIAYAKLPLPRSFRDSLRQFWQRLVEVVERPMSAGV